MHICSRASGVHDMHLDLHEPKFVGPLLGCVKGCCTFWCCCRGPWALYCVGKSFRGTRRVLNTEKKKKQFLRMDEHDDGMIRRAKQWHGRVVNDIVGAAPESGMVADAV